MKPLVILCLALPFAAAYVQAQPSSRVQVGDRVEVLWLGSIEGVRWTPEGVWIPATITEVADHPSVRATFPAEAVGMYTESGEANEWFPHSSVRLPGETEPLTAELTSPSARSASSEPLGSAPATPATLETLSAEFAVGDRVRAWCFGDLEDAVVTAVEPDRYRLRFAGYSSVESSEQGCGAYREADAVQAAEPERPKEPAPPSRPLPAALPTGAYVCFASIPHYAGSTYVSGVGSVPNYTFTWERVGDLAITSASTVSIGGSTFGYAYDAATGAIMWRGGMHEGVVSNAGYDSEGEFQIEVHREDGRRGTWACQR